MHSVRECADLLAGVRSARQVDRLAAALGFDAPLALDREGAAAIGLRGCASAARVAGGPGLLRLCVVTLADDDSPSAGMARCANRLMQHAPHFLWLVIAVQARTRSLVLGVPPSSSAARVTALLMDTARVLESDAETVAAMAAAVGSSDQMTHHRWAELLGRDQLTRRFYRELEGAVHRLAASRTGRAPDVARQELALLTTSRLLFIAFLEAKGWLNGDREFLRHHYDGLCAQGGRVHRRLLDPLFFGTLNTPTAKRSARALAFGHVPFLNGGLFARTASEHRWRDGEFSDDALGGVIATLLGRYRVTAREQSSGLAEAAVDPEMLGRSFESLMASDDRRKSGAFYTPLPILERVTAEAIDEWLATRGVPPDVRLSVRANEPLAPAWRATILEAVGTLRLIDPACGSGAFLVHALERIADLRGKAGDRRSVSERRREVLTRSIFGVDINPTATWLCELRLWLSVVIDEPQRDGATVPPLPNLDHNIRVGDALAGAAFETTVAPEGAARLTVLRARYARSSGVRKRTLARELDRAERRCALADTAGSLASVQSRRREALLVFRGRNLFGERAGPASAGRERDVQADLVMLRGEARALRARLRAIRDGAALPFSFRTHFADVGAAGGFDIVLGNPPWVRIHRLPPAMREEFARRYAAWRNAPWTVGADATGAGRGFAAQVDLAALFVERSTQLTRDNGVISLLVPAKLWTSLSAGGVRDVVQRRCRLVALEDWSESPASFDAVVYPSLLVARRADAAPVHRVATAVHRRDRVLAWETENRRIALDDSRGAPWVLVPPEVRRGFDLLVERGTPLAASCFGAPRLGVKTGCNDAFVVAPRPGWRDGRPANGDPWVVRAGNREDEVERGLLRPVLRGECVRAWAPISDDTALIWTHAADGRPLATLPTRAGEWLRPWRRTLESRTDARHADRWWAQFRTEAADMARHRVVWSDISKEPRALVLEADDPTVPLNTCYMVAAPTREDAYALSALLNSAPIAAWLAALAEPARGGYRRYMGWTLARLPLPVEWSRARQMLAPVGERARAGTPPDAQALARLVASAYRIAFARLGPLLTWCLR